MRGKNAKHKLTSIAIVVEKKRTEIFIHYETKAE
jgi:hypothetical protein